MLKTLALIFPIFAKIFLMNTFEDFNLPKQLLNAINDLGFSKPTPIQEEVFNTILSGKDVVGIAQTGTGKTIAFLLPILKELKYSEQTQARILILVPTRELVLQMVKDIESLTKYINIRALGVYGGTNINTQKHAVAEGSDILVATPGRLFDLAISQSVKLKSIKKLVIDEVDIMLDFGYKTQLNNIFEQLPRKRQNILFSATMTTYVDGLIDDFLINPVKKTISISGTPLDNIKQEKYAVPNFYSKTSLLNHLLEDKEEFSKVLIFVATKVNADRLAELLDFESEISVIHSSKEQNYRTKSIEKFVDGTSRILIATDVIARGIDIENISTVISFDTPFYPENYIHRIGRTGRAGLDGRAILFYSEKETELKNSIESLMDYTIPFNDIPEGVKMSSQLTPEEKNKPIDHDEIYLQRTELKVGPSFQEKSAKNSKVVVKKKSYNITVKEKYKKPVRRGDKIQNLKKKRKKK